jgi:hypothetical protein
MLIMVKIFNFEFTKILLGADGYYAEFCLAFSDGQSLKGKHVSIKLTLPFDPCESVHEAVKKSALSGIHYLRDLATAIDDEALLQILEENLGLSLSTEQGSGQEP